MLGEKRLAPLESLRKLRKMLRDMIWPSDEEAHEYRRQLALMEEEEWYSRGERDATGPTKKGHPPHQSCPCNLCQKYWEGFWSHL